MDLVASRAQGCNHPPGRDLFRGPPLCLTLGLTRKKQKTAGSGRGSTRPLQSSATQLPGLGPGPRLEQPDFSRSQMARVEIDTSIGDLPDGWTEHVPP